MRSAPRSPSSLSEDRAEQVVARNNGSTSVPQVWEEIVEVARFVPQRVQRIVGQFVEVSKGLRGTGRSWKSPFPRVSKCPGFNPRSNPARFSRVLEARNEAGAFVLTVYEMANQRRPGVVYKCWAQEDRLCVSACRRDFSQGCVGRDQVADETIGLLEVVARPRTGRKLNTRVACRRGSLARALTLRVSACVSRSPVVQALTLRVNAYGTVAGTCFLLMVLWCGSVITLMKGRVGIAEQTMEQVRRWILKENAGAAGLGLHGQNATLLVLHENVEERIWFRMSKCLTKCATKS